MLSLDASLSRLAPFGPEYGPSLSSHVPMVLEVLDRLDRLDAAEDYLGVWTRRLRPLAPHTDPELGAYPAALENARSRIERLGTSGALAEAMPGLASGMLGAAFHGLIRVAHAARSVARAGSPERREELARALAYADVRASAPPPVLVPSSASATPHAFSEGLARVVAPARASAPRSGLITPDIEARLGSGELLRNVCETLEISSDRRIAEGDLRRASLSLYLGTSHHRSADFVLLHGVTAVDAVAALLPFAGAGADLLLSAMATALTALRIAYVPEVSPLPPSSGGLEPELVRVAIASGDDHAIKLAGACASGHAIAPELPWARALAKAVRP